MNARYVKPHGGVLQNAAPCVSPTWQLPAHVLIVEDEVLLLAFGAGLLAEAGFDLMEAPDAEHALDYLIAHPEVKLLFTKLLFTDVRLPGAIDGLALAGEVHDRWPQIGIIVASGQAAPQPHELPAGTRFHRKPYDAAAVVRHARELTRA
jgi:CheY-like chemotaxis protein